MLALENIIINRLRDQIPGFVTISNPSALAGLQNLGALLPACIVMPGAGTLGEQTIPKLPLIEDQEWHVIVIIGHQHIDSQDGLTEAIASDFMTQVLTALQGWKHSVNPHFRGFIYQGREAPVYNAGYAEFPINFLAKYLIGE